MKKIILFCFLIVAVSQVYSQIQPVGKPKPIELPTPKIRPFTKADLEITNIQLVSVVLNTTTKLTTVRVSLTIHNGGQLSSTETNVKAFIQNIAPGVMGWTGFAEGDVPVPVITGGQSITREYSFVESGRVLKWNRFNFKVRVDPWDRVPESNDNNNFSASLNNLSSR